MGENSDIFQEMFVAGLEAVSYSAEKVKGVVDELVKEGKVSDEKGRKFAEEAMQKGINFEKEIENKIVEMVQKYSEKMNLASHTELNGLREEIVALKDRVKKLEESKEGEKKTK